jgi:hypothetical protein
MLKIKVSSTTMNLNVTGLRQVNSSTFPNFVTITEAINYAYKVAYNSSGININIFIDNSREHYILLNDI